MSSTRNTKFERCMLFAVFRNFRTWPLIYLGAFQRPCSECGSLYSTLHPIDMFHIQQTQYRYIVRQLLFFLFP